MKINKNLTKGEPFGIYIHIPFCQKKCEYCGFLSFEKSTENIRDSYAKALTSEITTQGLKHRNREVDTIFIGGGTPSLLSSNEISKIMEALKDNFAISTNCEITIEANPKTLDEKKLTGYLSFGINRLSIGVQSLNDEMLKALGRIHTRQDFLDNYNLARKTGFTNINIDLMFAIPGHTKEIWEKTVEEAISLGPEHISFYSLQLEEETPFYKAYKHGFLELNSNEEERQMYHGAIEKFNKTGYDHYEISNVSLPGYKCRHNLKYWNLDDYLGIGLGAHSYINQTRYNNVNTLEEYFNLVANGQRPIERKSKHIDTMKDAMSIYAFTSLRKREGIDLTDFKRRFNNDFFKVYVKEILQIKKYEKAGFLTNDEKYLALTQIGIDQSNEIMAMFV
ncbi:MAG: radical SAM family heme chaperone HemW [Anaerovoracaceae bacterium]